MFSKVVTKIKLLFAPLLIKTLIISSRLLVGCFSFGEFSWFGLFGLCFSFLFSLCFCFCLVVLFWFCFLVFVLFCLFFPLSIMLFLMWLNFQGRLVYILFLLTQYPLHDQQFCPWELGCFDSEYLFWMICDGLVGEIFDSLKPIWSVHYQQSKEDCERNCMSHKLHERTPKGTSQLQ